MTEALFGPCVGGCCCAPYTCQDDGLNNFGIGRLFSENQPVRQQRTLRYVVNTDAKTGATSYVAAKPAASRVETKVEAIAAVPPVPKGTTRQQIRQTNHFKSITKPQVKKTARQIGPKKTSTRIRPVSHEEPTFKRTSVLFGK